MKNVKAIVIVTVIGIALVGAFALSGRAKTELDVNKDTVTNFYKLAFIDFVNGFVAKYPHLKVDIKRVIAEGNLVVTHVLITTDEKDRGLAAMDIFRLENGKIVEHWDVVQPVPDKPANENGMF